ncbi:MAG TPA: sigma-70 family RNA polymerase sigma factor [Candidatus Paceibacterota bacterium]|jgi:RNA polymerase sigma-70 factor (ECF subfamily)
MDQTECKAYFLAAYDAYADELYRFCFMKVSNREKAEDLVQDTFTRFWQVLRDGTAPENPRAFLYTLARNRVIDWYRKKKESSLDVLQEAGIDFADAGIDDIVENAEMTRLMAVINELDEPSRDVLLLRFMEGWTPQEIADLNGESANAVSVRLNRALSKVRTKIHANE